MSCLNIGCGPVVDHLSPAVWTFATTPALNSKARYARIHDI